MRYTLLLFSLLFTCATNAQVKIYNDSAINTVLTKELHKIEAKLYYAIVNGEITSYKRDSLNYDVFSTTDTFSKEEAKFREVGKVDVKTKKGTTLLYSPLDTIYRRVFRILNDSVRSSALMDLMNSRFDPLIRDTINNYLLDTNYTSGQLKRYIDNNYNDTIIPVFFNPKRLRGITAFYIRQDNINRQRKDYSLDFISIDYQPYEYSSDPGLFAVAPIFYFKIGDLKNALNKKEIEYVTTFSNVFFGDRYSYSYDYSFSKESWLNNKLEDIDKKWGQINDASISVASKNLFTQCTDLCISDKFSGMFYADSSLSKPLDSTAYQKCMYFESIIQVYPDPNDPYYVIDSVYHTKRGDKDITGLVFTRDAIGFVISQSADRKHNATIYIKKSDLYKNCKPWGAFILKEYLD